MIMALIKCTECGKEFSDRALACPNCACPTEVVLEDIKNSTNSSLDKKEQIRESKPALQKEKNNCLDKIEILKEVKKMEIILDTVQQTGVWSNESGCKASKQLRQDLCFFTVFLGVSDNGFTKQRYNFINDVLRYNLDRNDISSIVRNAEYENGKKFYDLMVEGIVSVILDACDAEDELRKRGMDSNICLPDEVATLFGKVGKAFLGAECSRAERAAYTDYMMNINTFLSEEGYMDGSAKSNIQNEASFLENDKNEDITLCKENSTLRVEDVFTIAARGSVVTGVIEGGPMSVGDVVSWELNGRTMSASISGIEKFRKRLTVANVGDNVGILLKGVNRDEIKKGCIICL